MFNKIREALYYFIGLCNNWISIWGIVLTTISAMIILILLIFEAVGLLPHTNVYANLLAFALLPGSFCLGLVMIFVGVVYQKLFKKEGSKRKLVFPSLDFNDYRVRRTGFLIAVLTLVNILLLTGAGMKALEFAESVEFCGLVCHKVMNPEYTAYQYSPHSRVECVKCHVGPGLSAFVSSKINGLRQVWGVLTNSYRRPIPTPVEHMRPARFTCEGCHWPGKFYGNRLVVIKRYNEDRSNTERTIRLIMHTNGESPGKGKAGGIHWHINTPMWYISTDKRRQKIPWVQAKIDGKMITFFSKEADKSRADIEKLPKREMSCIDCHNRATHVFPTPDRALDQELEAGNISKTLPFIKKKGMEVLAVLYKSREAGYKAIRGLADYYKKEFPQLSKKRSKDIKQAIKTMISIFNRTQFPHMRASWRAHPNNIGHRDYPGCFRCHDGKHVSENGLKIRSNCNMCHTLLQTFKTKQVTIREPKHKIECTRCHNVSHRSLLTHKDAKPKDIRPEKKVCLSCHTTILEKHPLHGKRPCIGCHTVHGDDRIPNKNCLGCHKGVEEQKIHVAHAKSDMRCIECHRQDQRRIPKATLEVACSQCHPDSDFIKNYLKKKHEQDKTQ